MAVDDPTGALATFVSTVAGLAAEATSALGAVEYHEELELVVRQYLGRRGRLSGLKSDIAAIPPSDRRAAGRVLNEAVEALQAAVDAAKHRLGSSPAAADAAFDTTLPGTDSLVGGLHPILQMNEDLNCAFAALNFDMYSGPEISNELFEFDHMNFPAGHPARESMDTFWLSGSQKTDPARHFCLRPHLTGASVRFMAAHEPPYRFVYPGRVYRNESVDARHERAFFQYEALIVDRDVPFSSGKLLISTVLDTVFGRPVPTRMRTGFFPFVEPGFEIDMQCQVCSGAGCTVCKRVGWLEIMPGGVIHPEVLQAAGVDADEWTGFYVNVGLDRLVMMRYGIDDIRAFNGCDLRFLEQFR